MSPVINLTDDCIKECLNNSVKNTMIQAKHIVQLGEKTDGNLYLTTTNNEDIILTKRGYARVSNYMNNVSD